MIQADLNLDEVWANRQPCKACRGGHHHRYVIVGLPAEHPQSVMVRELLLADDGLRGGSYPLSIDLFGDEGKGGLELIGRWDGAHVRPLPAEALAA